MHGVAVPLTSAGRSEREIMPDTRQGDLLRHMLPAQDMVARSPESGCSQRYGGSRTGPLYGADNDSCPDALAFATVRSLPTRSLLGATPKGEWWAGGWRRRAAARLAHRRDGLDGITTKAVRLALST